MGVSIGCDDTDAGQGQDGQMERVQMGGKVRVGDY